MLPAKRVGVVRREAPCPFDDRVHIEPSQDKNVFPITLVIGNALWLDVLVANCTFKLFKLACNNRIGNGTATASVTE
jgi:hypothetical protein